MNWIKRLFCKEEVRVISEPNSNAILANYLDKLVSENKFNKSYKGINEFIEKYSDVTQGIDLKKITVTQEITSLSKKFINLSYKYSDVKLTKLINRWSLQN